MSLASEEKARSFLSISSQYKLGNLITESSHPDTRDLSHLAKNDLKLAIEKLKKLDHHVVDVLAERINDILALKKVINDTFSAGNNVYFCGCGATGRLSLTIETLWRQAHRTDNLGNRVFSFMAGGDVALIRSIENFEDYPQYGAMQLLEAGFSDGDLLIGTTEGGETPWVIGAVEKASEISRRKPFFLYCNPDDLLIQSVERSEKVIRNSKIEKINLTVGPMAVTGSTRMQSSTILLAVAGIPLLLNDLPDAEIKSEIEIFRTFWKNAELNFLQGFTALESDYYLRGEYLLYETDDLLGITVMTDTTERSPTFSLFPFENSVENEKDLSLCYLYLPYCLSSGEAWKNLLWRSPRTLEWPEINGIASMRRLIGFDFSAKAYERREQLKESVRQHKFKILNLDEGLYFNLETEEFTFKTPFHQMILRHLALKMIMNIHSTLIMGRLGRYEGNVMTYLRASNNKLIDRAIRYIDMLLKNKNIFLSYSEICSVLFEVLEYLPSDQSVVMAVVERIAGKQK